jgi:hypothetical protein
MWGETCPILTETKPWWNDESLKPTASKYWKKRSYIFQGLVIDDPLKEDEKPENPIRRFVIGKQIFNIIKTSLLDPEFETIPTDYINGTDFTITRNQKGDYADYSASKWNRRESALTEDQLEAIEKYGLKDLSEYLPKKPSPEQLAAIFEMFEASLAGELYDPSRWAQHYRPYGFEYQEDSSPKVSVQAAPKAEPAPADDDGDIPFETKEEATVKAEEPAAAPAASEENEGGTKSAEDILNMIRSRNK